MSVEEGPISSMPIAALSVILPTVAIFLALHSIVLLEYQKILIW